MDLIQLEKILANEPLQIVNFLPIFLIKLASNQYANKYLVIKFFVLYFKMIAD